MPGDPRAPLVPCRCRPRGASTRVTDELALFRHLPASDDPSPDAVLDGFLGYVAELGLTLYPHQEEAILALIAGQNAIVHTPTGSGKSLIATAVHFKAVAEGRRSFYTSPIKALVNEKFFELCRTLGPERVGMMTGDATVNREAPVVCCTAEVLANIALSQGETAPIDHVVMDEFHYFSDRERGVAWQVPLLTLPQARFALMSATLGDVSPFVRLLERHTGAPVATVTSAERPVPLRFEYKALALHEAIEQLVVEHRAPVYVVQFTQRAAAEAAQSLLSANYCTKEEKAQIAEALADVTFRSPYGRELRKLLRHGVGLHHAGLLPRYRLAVEKLAQLGLLKVICGTDTLGVGINVPIRTVLFGKLCKYDGSKVKILPARDFHQIAGRAGRKGFDDVGYVVALAPQHVVENLKLEAKAASGKGKRRFVRKKPPEWGYAHWDESTFRNLVAASPEPLRSRFRVTQSMLLQVLGRPTGGCRAMKDVVRDSLDTVVQKRNHRAHALVLLRSLWQAGVIEFRAAHEGGGIRVNAELQADFSLFQTLALYVLDAVERLDRESPSYALDVVTLVEAVIEDPDVVLRRQVDKLRTEKLAELKAQGVEYDERMAELEKIEPPRPNEAFLRESFALFAKEHPWVRQDDLRPKSVAREMAESLQSFGGYVKAYGLMRSEGVLLRYLANVYKTLVQTVPEGAHSEELLDVIDYLGAVVRGVDSSLLDEWERLRSAAGPRADEARREVPEVLEPYQDTRRFVAMIRNLMHSILRAIATQDYEAVLFLVEPGRREFSARDLEVAFKPLQDEGGLVLDGFARSPSHTVIREEEDAWYVTQNIVIGEEISEYVIAGRIDRVRSRAEKRPVFLLDEAGAASFDAGVR